MGKPTNTRSAGCAVTTSNCVIWQGPDLCCIDLCHGDSISEVINEIAKKICKIFEVLDIQSYDISALVLTEGLPTNFVELTQVLIDQVAGTGTSSSALRSATAAVDPDMTVATCFQPRYGTLLPMSKYVTAMGSKICDQDVVIQTQNNAIAQLSEQITNIQRQLNLLIAG